MRRRTVYIYIYIYIYICICPRGGAEKNHFRGGADPEAYHFSLCVETILPISDKRTAYIGPIVSDHYIVLMSYT